MIGQVSEYIHLGEFYDLVNGKCFYNIDFYKDKCSKGNYNAF